MIRPRLIAIVGRPNVGKSALFNRLTGRRIAIVHDRPGVTRDRVTAEFDWRGTTHTLVDTGGIGLLRGERSADVILRAAIEQVELAIDAAEVIILVVNVQEGLVPLDLEAAVRLRASGKPVVVAVNKVDNDRARSDLPDFDGLGFERVVPVSAIHGRGIEDLMEAVHRGLPPADERPADEIPAAGSAGDAGSVEPAADKILKLAIVGRPNVGKSSLINAVSRSERVIVSPVPGTTRDSVDVLLDVTVDGVLQRYILIDTAGMRKSRRIDDSIEFFSVKRAEESIGRCDIAVLVLDADSGVTEQDKHIAGKIVEERKACIIVVNKWDLYKDEVQEARKELQRKADSDRRTKGSRSNPGTGHAADARNANLAEFGAWVQRELFFMDYAPVVFVSAKSRFHLDRLIETVGFVAGQMVQTIPTGILNRTLKDAIDRHQPPSSAGVRFKFFYATQVHRAPPGFLLFVNRSDLFTPQYGKWLVGEMRRSFGFEGCPVTINTRRRPKTIDSIRKSSRKKTVSAKKSPQRPSQGRVKKSGPTGKSKRTRKSTRR